MHYHVVHLEISNQPSNPATWCSSARVACFHPGRCREDPGPSLMRLGVGTLMSESTTVTRVPVISKCLSYISSANAFPAVDDEHGSFDIITASCKYARRPASLTAAHSLHIGRPAGSRSIGSGAPRRKPFSPSWLRARCQRSSWGAACTRRAAAACLETTVCLLLTGCMPAMRRWDHAAFSAAHGRVTHQYREGVVTSSSNSPCWQGWLPCPVCCSLLSISVVGVACYVAYYVVVCVLAVQAAPPTQAGANELDNAW